MLHQSEKSCDIRRQGHRTNGEFTCRTELIGDVEGSSRHITGFAWGATVNRGAGGRKRGRQ